jgi:iron complex transport system substrate-binding protein
MTIRSTLTTLLVAALLVTAGCGDSGSSDEASAPAKTTASSFPVTVEQKLGPVTIDAEPKRVVALDFPSADAVIALGVVPVGMYDVSYVKGGVQEWTKTALGTKPVPKLIATDAGFPMEKIAALRPDVIVATNTYPLISESWKELNRIAPVVGHVQGPGVDTWQQGVRQVAKALGRQERGEEVVTATERVVSEAARQHPEFADKKINFFNYVAGDGLYVISDEDDVSIKFLTGLGFAGLPPATTRMRSQDGRAPVSPERYDLLDADLILGTSPDPKALDALADQKLFAAVPAVRRGAYVPMGIGPATAMAFPSVLSVPYAVQKLVPQLAAGVRRGGSGS